MCSNSRGVVVVVAFTLGAWVGCSKRPGDSEALPTLRGCFDDDQCEAEEKCVFRLCSPGCDADRRCDGDAQCVETGRGLACIRVQDNACLNNSDCPQAVALEAAADRR
jgi:hypothetical protein